MKKIKLLSLFAVLAISVVALTACKDKGNNKPDINNDTNQQEGYDEIEFDDDVNSTDAEVDFDTESVISSVTSNSDNSSGNTSSGTSSENESQGGTSDNESENVSSGNESESKPNDSSTPEDTTSSDLDKESMEGWTPWQ